MAVLSREGIWLLVTDHAIILLQLLDITGKLEFKFC